jgi:OOP family OmpA-OmpF porin
MKRKSMRAAFAVLGMLAGLSIGAPASAQDMAFYAGVSLGQAKAQDTCDFFAGTGISCDDKDTAWKIFGGYQFNRNFALELGYTDLGEVTISDPFDRISIEVNAFELVGIGMFPVADRFSVYGKAGLYRAETELTSTIPGLASKETNNDLTFGFGVRFDIGRFAVRAEWQRYSDVGGGDIGEDDIDVISIGGLFKF